MREVWVVERLINRKYRFLGAAATFREAEDLQMEKMLEVSSMSGKWRIRKFVPVYKGRVRSARGR